MSDLYPQAKSRDPSDLRAQIMDLNIPKNDAEWWAATHIRELEAANAICRTDIEALMTSCDKLEARNTELEVSRDYYRTAGDSATLRAAQLTERNNYQLKRNTELEAERDEWHSASVELAGKMETVIDSLRAERDRLKARLEQTAEFIKRWDDGERYGDWSYPEFKAEYEAIRDALSDPSGE